MDILCGGCGRTLTVDDGEIVHDLPCPHCGRLIRMSAMGEGVPEEDARLLAPLQAEDDLADDFLTKAKLALKKKLLVVCSSCGEKLTVDQRLAGGPARCPSCGKQIQVPSINEDGEHIARKALPVDLDVEPSSAGGDAGQAQAITTAAAGRPRHRRPIRRQRRSKLLAILLLASLGTGVAGILLGYMVWGRPAETAPEPRQHMPEGPTKRDPWASAPDTPKPVQTPTPLPTTAPLPPPPPPPTPPSLKPALSMVKAALKVLAEDSLIPAPAGKAFLLATLRLHAGDEPIDIDSGAVVLHTADAEFPALGVPAPKGAFAVGARKLHMRIPPTDSRVETFVFVVPPDLAGGAVHVAGVGQVALRELPKIRSPKRKELPGTYGETARFLKLSFADPVMEKLRSAGSHRIVITGRKDHLDVAIPQTPIRGQATSDGGGTYKLDLTDGSKTLAGWLRFLPDGRRLVLYLADAPYHQVVYERRQHERGVAPSP